MSTYTDPVGFQVATRAEVVYCGFTDRANVGDYALYRANCLLFPQFRFEGQESTSEVNLLGGGTLYPYCLRYKTYRKRPINHAIGIGVLDPDLHGRFGPLTVWAMKRWRFGVFGVRGPRSRRILARYGIEAEVTGDTALIHRPTEQVRRSEGVAISLVGEAMQRFGEHERVGREATEFARIQLAAGRRVTLVPFCDRDLALAERIRDDLRGQAGILSFWEGDGELQPFLDKLARFELVVGERLHACVLAAALDVPFIPIGYKPKCFDFMESLGMVDQVIDSRTLTAELLDERATRTLREADRFREEVSRRVGEYRRRLREAAERITESIGA
jgi:polysaccharide pyruvyl transferase WcaK-like protein